MPLKLSPLYSLNLSVFFRGPDQGLGSKDPRLGSKDPKMGSKDGRLASKAGREDFADFVRGSLTCQVPMQPMVTLAALAHHFQQSPGS